MKNRYILSILLTLYVLNISPPVFPAEQKVEKLAQDSAESWLALVDAGKYLQSWNEAASFFKQQVKSEQWESAVKSVREPLGKIESRKMTRAQYTRTIPGAPDGEYVILQFETSFAKKKSAIRNSHAHEGPGWTMEGGRVLHQVRSPQEQAAGRPEF